VASREVGCSSECYRHRSRKRIGLLTPTRNSLFPTARWFSLGAFPRSLARLGSSSRELYPLFRVRPDCHLSDTRKRRTPPRVPFPFATQVYEVHLAMSFPRPSSCALDVSHALDALLLHIPRGPISSHSHVRDSHFRGFPCRQAGSPHRRVVPSCR
jgi:hypothetical protein